MFIDPVVRCERKTLIQFIISSEFSNLVYVLIIYDTVKIFRKIKQVWDSELCD
jgi:hypothetical protein